MALSMVVTFVAAVATMLMGVAGLSRTSTDPSPATPHLRSPKLMALRVGLCVALLAQIVLYISWFKA